VASAGAILPQCPVLPDVRVEVPQSVRRGQRGLSLKEFLSEIDAEPLDRCMASTTDECRFTALKRKWAPYTAAAVELVEGHAASGRRAVVDVRRDEAIGREQDVLARAYFDLAASLNGSFSIAAGCRAAEVLLAYTAYLRFDDDVAPTTQRSRAAAQVRLLRSALRCQFRKI
jgi:hypothetical protein